MITEYHDAWLLHKKPSGDTSLQLTFLTQEAGLVRCHYRGGRTPKKQSLLQLFMPVWMTLDARHDWHYLNRLEAVQVALSLQGLSLFAGLYVNELLYYALSPWESQSELFNAYQVTLRGLAAVNSRLAIEALLRRFELIVLSSCGYYLDFTMEVHNQRAIEGQSYYQFIPGQGFERAEKGIPGEAILAIADYQWDDLRTLKAAKWIMRQAIDHLLGDRVLKSRSLFPDTLAKRVTN